jgi:putative oxidoreductase
MKRDVPFMIAKILLGVAFLVFGLNGFLNFLPIPPVEGKNAQAFLGALVGSGFLKVVKFLEIAGGFMVLSGRLAPLGLLLLGPIVVCIALFDITMDPKGIPVIVVLGALSLFVAYKHKEVFAPFFHVRGDQCTFHPDTPRESS